MQLSPQHIEADICRALAEDLDNQSPESGDITARLIDPEQQAKATIITREDCILCGVAWAEEAFRQVDARITMTWLKQDGEHCEANQTLCTLSGPARGILTAERTALNFLQTLSATATTTAFYVAKLARSNVTLLDTRKTLPGMRLAQKYAVRCGGGQNHRVGLYDAFLIKENHIMACGSIAQAVEKARNLAPGKPVEVEVESVDELQQAIAAGADIAMLDNFDEVSLRQAVKINSGKIKLEVSGNITDTKLAELAGVGIDFISSGALTKHVNAIDLSLKINKL